LILRDIPQWAKTIEDRQKNYAHEKGQTFAYIDVECASELFF
jgi:hypothetical protein